MTEDWFQLASDARKAANQLVRDHHRSCLSRTYYAAYSRVTHELNAVGNLTFPVGREGPNHPGKAGSGGICRMIRTSMPGMDAAKRLWLSQLISELYTLRINADYRPSTSIDGRDARKAVSILSTVFDTL